jgi:hypothetical protein
MMLLGGVALALFVLDAAADARAPQSTPPGAQPPERSERASRRKPRIVHLPSPAQESSAQRDRRLARECRGLPNAGACLGYAGAQPRAAARR